MIVVIAIFAIFIGSIGVSLLYGANNPFSTMGMGDRAKARKLGNTLLAIAVVLLFVCVSVPTGADQGEIVKQRFMLH